MARLAIKRRRLAEFLGISTEDELPGGELLVSMLFQKLHSTLLTQQKRIRKEATVAQQKDYLRLLYVMATLTDELLLLDTDWEFANLWQEELLEEAMFQTSEAGTRFYHYAEELMSDRSGFENKSDLAAVFLVAISLGFRGRYRGKSGKLELQKVRQQLFSRLDSRPRSDHLFTQAYQNTISESEDPVRDRIAPLSRWYKYGATAFATYIVVSSLIWKASSEILIDRINSLDIDNAPATTADSTVSSEPQLAKLSVNPLSFASDPPDIFAGEEFRK